MSTDERTEIKSRIRSEIQRFALFMDLKLSKHERQRGDSWRDEPVSYLMDRLEEEVEELKAAVAGGESAVRITAEAADVANFAMMIHEVRDVCPEDSIL